MKRKPQDERPESSKKAPNCVKFTLPGFLAGVSSVSINTQEVRSLSSGSFASPTFQRLHTKKIKQTHSDTSPSSASAPRPGVDHQVGPLFSIPFQTSLQWAFICENVGAGLNMLICRFTRLWVYINHYRCRWAFKLFNIPTY